MLATFPDADLALQNSGGLRADIPSGQLRREHIQAVMPFDNRLVLLELEGKSLELALRVGSSGAHGIMQVAGGSYHFDPSLEEGSDLDGDDAVARWETNRLCAATVDGAAIDPARTYRVVTTDFLRDGDNLVTDFQTTILCGRSTFDN